MSLSHQEGSIKAVRSPTRVDLNICAVRLLKTGNVALWQHFSSFNHRFLEGVAEA